MMRNRGLIGWSALATLATIGPATAIAASDADASESLAVPPAMMDSATSGDTPPLSAFSASDRQAIDDVNAYLNGIAHMQGKFLQVNPQGQVAEGTFYLERPGRLRFEYEPPAELLVVADGNWVAVQEDFGGAQRYPIGSTPLSLMLKSDVDLARDAEILSIDRTGQELIVTVADKSGEAPGTLTMLFSTPKLDLRQWVVRDAQGLETSVALIDVTRGVKADAALFVLPSEVRPQIGPRGKQ